MALTMNALLKKTGNQWALTFQGSEELTRAMRLFERRTTRRAHLRIARAEFSPVILEYLNSNEAKK